MKILRRKTVNDICQNAISVILIQAENYLYGRMNYNDSIEVINKEYDIISKVGGEKWVKIAVNALKKKIELGVKEVDTNVSKKGDKK
jgi:hypothetical protein